MDNFIPMPPQENVAAVSPQTTVILASGIEWGNDYEHVRYYENGKTGCLAHVKEKAIHTFKQSAPVRWGELTYKGKGNESEFLKCNYIAFQNKPYTEEWYFGFVTRVEWLSDGSFKIYFEPDRFQNSFYDVVLQPCYVEREHVAKADDAVGANLVPENLETGEYIVNGSAGMGFGLMNYCLVASADENGVALEPELNQKIMSGLTYFNTVNFDVMKQKIQAYATSGNADAIVAIFQAPQLCFENSPREFSMHFPETLAGYTPKNKKLFQYPFSYLIVDAHDGSQYMYRLEYFKDQKISFYGQGVKLNIPSIYISPKNYKNEPTTNTPYGFVYSNFPSCAWTNDAYQAWLAQSQPIWDYQTKQQYIDTGKSVISTIANVLSGNFGKAIESSIGQTVSNFMFGENISAQMEQHDLIPPTAKGSATGSYIQTALFSNTIALKTMCVTPEMAKVIDDYFTMYGYATHRIKVPNITGRTNWNFVKTVNCGLHGTCVTDDINFLQSMFNKGVTFWHTDDVGNYGLSND